MEFNTKITDVKCGVAVTAGFVAVYCAKNSRIRKDFKGPGTAFWRTKKMFDGLNTKHHCKQWANLPVLCTRQAHQKGLVTELPLRPTIKLLSGLQMTAIMWQDAETEFTKHNVLACITKFKTGVQTGYHLYLPRTVTSSKLNRQQQVHDIHSREHATFMFSHTHKEDTILCYCTFHAILHFPYLIIPYTSSFHF